MKLPDLDPTGGPLQIDQVLLDYDGPQLFSARNYGGALFLALHGPSFDGDDTWLFARTTRHRLGQLQNGIVSLRDVMTKFARGHVALVSYKDEAPTFELLHHSDVHESYLPHEESYFRAGGKPLHEFPVRYAPTVEFEVDPLLPVPVEQDLWEFDSQTIKYLKDNMTPLHIVARRRQRLVADIVLSDNEHRTDIPVPDLGRILISLQQTVDSLGSQDLAPDWKPTAGSKRETRLDAIATFPSSFGLRIEANQGSLADVGLAPIAFQRLVDLLASISDPDVLRMTFQKHLPSTKLYFGKFIDSIAKTKSSVRISSSSGISPDIATASVSSELILELSEKIKSMNEREFETIEVHGRLKAVSLRTKFFLIENDDESVSGRISDSLLPKISGMKIDVLYSGTVKITRFVHDVTGEIETKRELMSLDINDSRS